MQHARRRSDAPPDPDLDALAAEADTTRRRAEEYLARVGALLDAAERGGPSRTGSAACGMRCGSWARLRRCWASSSSGCPWSRCSPTWTGQRWKAPGMRPGSRPVSRRRRAGTVTAGAPGRRAAVRPPRRQDVEGRGGIRPGCPEGRGALNGHCRESRYRRPGPPVAAVVSLPTTRRRSAVSARSRPPRHDSRASAPLRPPACEGVPVRGHGIPGPPSSRGDVPRGRRSRQQRPQRQPAGRLDLATITCVAAASGTCQITFEAVGGPLEWHAPSSPDLALSSDEGTAG